MWRVELSAGLLWNRCIVESLRISSLDSGGRLFTFKEPLVVDVDFDDENWIYHNPRLNLWGHGDTREDALRDMQENFAYLWDEIAQEQDDLLDDRAIELKQNLLQLVAGQTVTT